MSLKEEIMYKVGSFGYSTNKTAEQLSDEILKLVEKRIDSIRLPQFENGIYTRPQLEYLAVCIASDIKREILK
jgi:hypothetical protein